MSNYAQVADLRILIEQFRSIPSEFVSDFRNTDTKSRLTLRLTQPLGEAIRNSAEYNRMSVNEYIIQALFEKLSFDTYLKQLEDEIDNFSLLTAERKAMPGNETLLDIDKFNESRLKYKEKLNASKFAKHRIMRTCS